MRIAAGFFAMQQPDSTQRCAHQFARIGIAVWNQHKCSSLSGQLLKSGNSTFADPHNEAIGTGETRNNVKEVGTMNKFVTALSLAALMSVPAVAQETTTPKATEMPAATQEEMPAATQEMPAENVVAYDAISASALLNKGVKNATNENIGDINDLQIGDDGKITAVIIGVGGFLGLGEKNVALPYDQLAFTRDADGALIVTANLTKESLQAMPEWKKDDKS